MLSYPDSLVPIFDKLLQNKIRPVIVGGYVRDYLLNKNSKDIDIEVYNIQSFEELENLLDEFGDVNSVGKSFGVCKLKIDNLELDFSLPREDNKTGLGHKGFKVNTNTNLDYKSAAIRRDFTINAIGYDVKEEKILDPFNGIKDLQNRMLNATNETTFIEDPLRILRAIQFSARFDLQLNKNLFILLKKMIKNSLLSELTQERVYEEIKKLLLKAKKPSKGFILLKEIDGLQLFPEINQLNQNSFNSTLQLLDAITKNEMRYKLAALSYKLTKEQTISFVSTLSSSKKLLSDVLLITQNYQQLETIYKNGIKDYDLYKLATKTRISDLISFNESLFLSQNNSSDYYIGEKIQKKAIELKILNQKAPEILQGKDILKIGIKPSKIYSKILEDAYEAQISKEFSSHKEAIIWLKNYCKAIV